MDDEPETLWAPSSAEVAATNIGRILRERRFADYHAFHAWSVAHREEFWELAIEKTGIVFRTKPEAIREPGSDVTHPAWLPGAEFNIVESCFHADPAKAAILFGREGTEAIERWTYRYLLRQAERVAHGIDRMGLGAKDRVALYLPMTPEAVAAYLGILKSGRTVVGIADTSAPGDLETRLRIAGVRAVVTMDAYVREGKELRIYEKALAANAPACVVLSSKEAKGRPTPLRNGDLAWERFLGPDKDYPTVHREPGDETHVLFSSGTTKDPKAIVWTQTTPIKCIADAYFHQDIKPDDVLAWPTSFGWMMGPWLTFASFALGATMALYNGSPTSRGFGVFVEKAKVTMLGVVPKLVRAWKASGVMESLDWTRIKRFSSTGETSDPDEMRWLMAKAGNKPVIEYCGGTEIGGGYITGTMVQPAAPGTFTTPALGLDFLVLNEEGALAERGEVAIVPPSIGLSNDLLNYDHQKEYYEGFFRGPKGEVLRRHGDQVERRAGGFFRHRGRIDDMINLNGVKTSAEEVRAVIGHHPALYDTKPFAIDLEGKGQHVLVVYAVPRDKARLSDRGLPVTLKRDLERLIKERLNPLLAHIHEVVLVAELPQAGPGKTRTSKDFVKDYRSRGLTKAA